MSERDPRAQHLRTCEQGLECLEATRKAIWQDFAAREVPTTASGPSAPDPTDPSRGTLVRAEPAEEPGAGAPVQPRL